MCDTNTRGAGIYPGIKIAGHKQPKTNLIMDSDENCSICYRKYGLQSNGIFLCKDGHSNSDYITTCEHWFCFNCINKFYIEQVYNCPICNENWLQWIKSRHFYLYHLHNDDDDNEDANDDDNGDVNADDDDNDNDNEDANDDDNEDVNADDDDNEDANENNGAVCTCQN